MKKVIFTKHALKQANDRGVSLEEIEQALIDTLWQDVRYNRYSSIKVFEYNQIWEEVFYRQKEVKVIFTQEDDKIIVITVIARYFKE